ncbi:MAG: class II aldolase/adducin family protein, partial [Oscillospiraceae bacterium]|nr:class II aldolase/adducin family protein [Oscillospiraceae bacterium]
MLEQLKSQVLIAYQELGRYGLDKYARGSVSAIDRESGMIVMKSARDAFVVDMHGNILEGSSTLSSDIQTHIALYQAFPKLGGIVRPHARYATIFAQIGM